MADPVGELHRRLADPLAFHAEECRRVGLPGPAGVKRHGVEHMTWWRRNHEAISMLREAERLSCKVRAGIIATYYHRLDPDALPLDFDRRLLLAFATADNRAGAGIRGARNEEIRRAFDVLISEEAADIAREEGRRPHTKMSLYNYLSVHFGLSEAQIRSICKKQPDGRTRGDDFRRLTEKRQLLISEANN